MPQALGTCQRTSTCTALKNADLDIVSLWSRSELNCLPLELKHPLQIFRILLQASLLAEQRYLLLCLSVLSESSAGRGIIALSILTTVLHLSRCGEWSVRIAVTLLFWRAM